MTRAGTAKFADLVIRKLGQRFTAASDDDDDDDADDDDDYDDVLKGWRT